jgi:hypothetical protein
MSGGVNLAAQGFGGSSEPMTAQQYQDELELLQQQFGGK